MNTFVYTPLYNLLVTLINLVPGLDLGIYIILFTIIVKFLLFPFAIKAIKAQQSMKVIEPKLKALQKKYKADKQELGVQMMALYKEYQVNPFASIGLILIQIPIIFGLYYIVLRAGLPEIDPTRLYSFVSLPDHTPSVLLLNILDVTTKSLPLALAAGLTQFIQTKIAMPQTEPDPDATPQQQMMQSVTKRLMYVFPVLITIFAYTLSVAVALYFITSNLFHIMQELYVKKRGFKVASEASLLP